jgi:hypothetical protein
MSEVKLYQPSNGTDGDYFMAEFCENCYHDGLDKDSPEGSCPILAATFYLDIKDNRYPNQWRYIDSKPTCIAFFEREGRRGHS